MRKSKFMQLLEEKYPDTKESEPLHTPKNWIVGLIVILIFMAVVITIIHFIIKYW